MLTVHHVLAFLVIAVCVASAALALVAFRRRRVGALVSHALALAQTLVVAQLVFGLLLLADHRHAEKGVHYMYGSLALFAVAWPWFYAPPAGLVRRSYPVGSRARDPRLYDRMTRRRLGGAA